MIDDYQEQVDKMTLQELLEEVIDMRVNYYYPGHIDTINYISGYVTARLFEILIEQNLSSDEIDLAKRIWEKL